MTRTVRTAVKKRLPWLADPAWVCRCSHRSSCPCSKMRFPVPIGAKLLAANLAIYLPLILDMSGNTGTQSLAVMIRYLST
ncbi:MAG: hypothetical protein MZU97_25310 [Bacillus subtilis]|nr:hypothetical protein [Bacillus subtilis]